MVEKVQLGVLVSGNGSNLQAILDACQDPAYPARVAVVLSNRSDAHGLVRAREAGVAALAVPNQQYSTRAAHEQEIIRQLTPYGVELLVLAGYMRVVTPLLLGHFQLKRFGLPGVINIHPADTRAYQGAHGYEFALGLLPQYPLRLSETQITVHFVDAGVDTGAVIQKTAVPVLPGDTLETLRARGLAVEHRVYPEVIRALVEGRVTLRGKEALIR